jgi:adhesin transport system membrane fusion protein
MKDKLSPQDYEFMHSLSAAMAEKTPRKMRWALYFWLIAVALFILWASLTEIDEITRGTGEVVPSGENQIVQNLEGGIIKEILVKVGDTVAKGQPLLKIDNKKFEAQLESTQIKELELQAKMIRLSAEAEGRELQVDKTTTVKMPQLIENEYSLYQSRQNQLAARLEALQDKQRQKEQELVEMKDKITHLKRSSSLIDKEVKMLAPMVRQGVKSRVSLMKLQREQSRIAEELSSARHAIPRLEASISEVQHTIEAEKIAFRNEAKKELNQVVAEVMRVKESSKALGDQMGRTMVRSPIKGVIQKLYVHTVGGTVRPGENLIEIVPTDKALWLEVKIKPSDIGFIYPGQKAIVKVSAYDFRIYGGLEGKVVHISADTTKDARKNAFFTIHVKTDKNYLGSEANPLKITPGMTVTVNIMTGKKTMMDYILKPILKAKQYTFTER